MAQFHPISSALALLRNDINIFIEYKSEILEHNRKIILMLYSLCTSILLAFYLASKKLPGIYHLKNTYFVFLIIEAVQLILVIFITKKILKSIMIFTYSGYITFHLFGFFISVIQNQARPASFWFVFLYIIPVLITDIPLRTNFFSIIVTTAFCILTYKLKSHALAVVDIVNAIANIILSLFVATLINRIKLDEILLRHKIIQQRDIDCLTTLPNRLSLFRQLGTTELPTSLISVTGIIMIDIDFFKSYNDKYGHLKGDSCLEKIGKCLQKVAEENNIEIYRYGGEEFIGLSFNNSYSDLKRISAKINKAIRDLNIPTEATELGIVTVSIGYAHKEDCLNKGYTELISAADLALYDAKKQGRNCNSRYHKELPPPPAQPTQFHSHVFTKYEPYS